MIEVQNLTKHYGPVTAIRDVSFSVSPGQIVDQIGDNHGWSPDTRQRLKDLLRVNQGEIIGAIDIKDGLVVRIA